MRFETWNQPKITSAAERDSRTRLSKLSPFESTEHWAPERPVIFFFHHPDNFDPELKSGESKSSCERPAAAGGDKKLMCIPGRSRMAV